MNGVLLSQLEFEQRIKNILPTIKVIGTYINNHTNILVQDELGICYKANPKSMLRKNKPSIKTAINKTDCYLTKVKNIHNNKYSYPDFYYKECHDFINIKCPLHGIFIQKASAHLVGQGCKKCAEENSRLSKEDFINRSKEIHNNKYDYSQVSYYNCATKVKIICPEHGIFQQLAQGHLAGYGCSQCSPPAGHSKSEWIHYCNKNKKECKLYIINCFNSNENFIKIGITTRALEERFYNTFTMPYKYNIIKEIKDSPENIWDKEKELHKICSPFKYTPKKYFSGETECFTLDSLIRLI